MAIDTKARANDQFYGKVYISGAVNVKGNRNGINVDVAVTTQPGSAFYLPLSNKSNMSEADGLYSKAASRRTLHRRTCWS